MPGIDVLTPNAAGFVNAAMFFYVLQHGGSHVSTFATNLGWGLRHQNTGLDNYYHVLLQLTDRISWALNLNPLSAYPVFQEATGDLQQLAAGVGGADLSQNQILIGRGLGKTNWALQHSQDVLYGRLEDILQKLTGVSDLTVPSKRPGQPHRLDPYRIRMRGMPGG